MKRNALIIMISFALVSAMCAAADASDYQGKEKQDTIFQKLGDLITGKYEVEGQPIKKKGVIQVVADQVKDMEAAPLR